jgi:hypothetical protein
MVEAPVKGGQTMLRFLWLIAGLAMAIIAGGC